MQYHCFSAELKTIATATATVSTAGTTMNFPDHFQTVETYFTPKFKIEYVHAWILTLITRFATTLSTTDIFLGGTIQGPT